MRRVASPAIDVDCDVSVVPCEETIDDWTTIILACCAIETVCEDAVDVTDVIADPWLPVTLWSTEMAELWDPINVPCDKIVLRCDSCVDCKELS